LYITTYVEEDFRLATPPQVRNYSPADLQFKPHLPGFGFTQLLDRLNGHVTDTPRPRLLVRAPGGTGYWISRHLSLRAAIELRVASSHCGPATRQGLSQLPGELRVTESDELPVATDHGDVTCTVLACLPDELLTWYEHCRGHVFLGRRLIVAYDPVRCLAKRPEGEYFFNSSIWVAGNDGH
jgi:hypothetical protein